MSIKISKVPIFTTAGSSHIWIVIQDGIGKAECETEEKAVEIAIKLRGAGDGQR